MHSKIRTAVGPSAVVHFAVVQNSVEVAALDLACPCAAGLAVLVDVDRAALLAVTDPAAMLAVGR